MFYGGRLVYEARGRTFRRPSRRNSAGPSPRRHAARRTVRPHPPYTGRSPLHRVPCPGVSRPGLYTKKRAAKARPACPAAPYMRLTASAPVPPGCFPHIESSTGPAPAYGVGADAPAAAPPPPTLPAEGSLFHPPPTSMHSGCTLPPGAPSPAGRCFPVPAKKLFPALLSAGNAPAASMCSCLRIPLLLPRL